MGFWEIEMISWKEGRKAGDWTLARRLRFLFLEVMSNEYNEQ
jgi:hypothetical protein